MSSNTVIRRLLLTPAAVRTTLIHPQRLQPIQIQHYSSALPVIERSFWAQMIPKPLRRDPNPDPNSPSKEKKPTEWNPGTFYIWIFLLIGSMSIQMIALKMRFKNSMNRAEAKISLLKEVIERVQKGEEVDVEGLLGRGNKQQELEWEEILQEAENEAELFKKPKKSSNVKDMARVEETSSQKEAPKPKKTGAPTGFY